MSVKCDIQNDVAIPFLFFEFLENKTKGGTMFFFVSFFLFLFFLFLFFCFFFYFLFREKDSVKKNQKKLILNWKYLLELITHRTLGNYIKGGEEERRREEERREEEKSEKRMN